MEFKTREEEVAYYCGYENASAEVLNDIERWIKRFKTRKIRDNSSIRQQAEMGY